MRYGIILQAIVLFVIAGVCHASGDLGPEELREQLQAAQRETLVEMGIILIIWLSGLGAFVWYMLRQPTDYRRPSARTSDRARNRSKL